MVRRNNQTEDSGGEEGIERDTGRCPRNNVPADQ